MSSGISSNFAVSSMDSLIGVEKSNFSSPTYQPANCWPSGASGAAGSAIGLPFSTCCSTPFTVMVTSSPTFSVTLLVYVSVRVVTHHQFTTWEVTSTDSFTS